MHKGLWSHEFLRSLAVSWAGGVECPELMMYVLHTCEGMHDQEEGGSVVGAQLIVTTTSPFRFFLQNWQG